MIKITHSRLADRSPMQYIVFDRDRLHEILSTNITLSTVDQLKMAVLKELLDDGLTLNDVLHVFYKYAIDLHARRAAGEIRRTVAHIHELPEEVSFVTCWVREERKSWDCKCDVQGWL